MCPARERAASIASPPPVRVENYLAMRRSRQTGQGAGALTRLARSAVFALAVATLAGAVPGRAAPEVPSELGLPPLEAFAVRDYGEHNQNWAAVQDRRGVLYVGNKNAVLTYDGATWSSLPIRAGIFINALAIDAEDRIWVGGNGQLGTLDDDGRGGRTFVSLLDRLPADQRGFGQIYTIAALSHGVYFCAEDGVLRWHDGAFTVTKFPVMLAHAAGDELIAQARGQPPQVTNGDGWRVLAPELNDGDRWLTFAARQPDGALLLGTIREGFWRLADGRLTRWPTEVDAGLKARRIDRAKQLRDGTLVIAQRPGGLLFLSPQGKFLQYLDADRGLPVSAVQSVFQDRHGDLWASLNNGLARLAWPPAVSVFNHGNGLGHGTVVAVRRYAGRLYVGTTEGLFVLASATLGSPPAPAHFVPVPGCEERMWDLALVGDELFALGVGGLRVLSGDRPLARVLNVGYTTSALSPRADPTIAYVGFNKQLLMLRRAAEGWRNLGALPGITVEVRHLAEAADGSVWIGTTNRGLLRVRGLPGTASADGKPPRVEAITGGHGLGREKIFGLPNIVEADGGLVFTADGMLFNFDAARGEFIPRPQPTAWLADPSARAEGIGAGVGGAHWVFTQRSGPDAGPWHGRQVWRLSADGTRTALPYAAVAAAGENIAFFEEPAAEGGSVLWLGGSEGLVRIALPLALAPPAEFHTYLRRVTDGTGAPLALAAAAAPVLAAERATLDAVFAADRLDGSALRFQVRLDDAPWSAPALDRHRTLAGLAPGAHTFAVRALDADGRAATPATLAFTVLPPWWRTWWAGGLLVLVGAGACTGIVRWRVGLVRARNRQLEQLVAERTRELALANTAKSEFLENISHEIRNPLSGIVGLISILKEENLPAPERELSRSLRACVRNLEQVFEEILSFSKLEYGYVTAEARPFLLAPLLEELRLLHGVRAEAYGCTLSVVLPPDFRDGFVGDAAKLSTIVGNFVSNALKYAPGAPVAIHLEVEPGAEGGPDFVTFEVRDHGAGIPADEQELIFKKFIRGTGARDREVPGTGLGLATCRALAELLGGSVGVESPTLPDGRGSTFFLRVPLARSAAPLAPTASAPAADRTPRALVVEDLAYNRTVLETMLRGLGYRVETAADVPAAHAWLARESFDLLLVDYELSGDKGTDLVRHLRAQPDGARPIVLAITAHDSDEMRARCHAAGADEYALKPLHPEKLRALIAAVQARRHSGASDDATNESPRITPTALSPAAPSAAISLADLFRFAPAGSAVIADYLAAFDTELAALHAATAAGHAEAAARAAHRLSGHAGLIGAREFCTHCDHFAHTARVGSAPWQDLVPALATAAAALKQQVLSAAPVV